MIRYNRAVVEKSFIYLTTVQPVVETQVNKRHFSLSVNVTAYPDPVLRWFKDDQEIKLLPDK